MTEEQKADQKLVPPDPFDPAALRLDQSFGEGPAVKKLITTIPVRRPSPQDFVRVHPAEEYRLNTAVINLKDDGEVFLVAPLLVRELEDECIPVTLFTTITRQKALTLWPVRLPGLDGKDLTWWRSAREAAELAMNSWVRMKANKALGAYDLSTATGSLPEPEWPPLTFQEILRIAFRDFMIDSIDHVVIKKLRGMV
jgi:hypothetical protein